MSQVEKQKLQNHVPAALVRALDIEIRKGKDPTLQTMSDGIAYCLEVGVAALAKMNQSEEGLYIAEVFAKLRRMELEEKVRAAEFATAGFQARSLNTTGTVSPIRRVEKEG